MQNIDGLNLSSPVQQDIKPTSGDDIDMEDLSMRNYDPFNDNLPI
jgi:hypothetical protein